MRPSIAATCLTLSALTSLTAELRAAPTCALWWEPGAPVAIWPHEAAPPEGRLEEGPGGGLLEERGGVLGGRPRVGVGGVGAIPT